MNEDVSAPLRYRTMNDSILSRLEKLNSLTILFLGGGNFKINSDGTLGGQEKNESLNEVLLPLLEEMKAVDMRQKGGGVMLLRKFAGRLLDEQIMTPRSLLSSKPYVRLPNFDFSFFFEPHLFEETGEIEEAISL